MTKLSCPRMGSGRSGWCWLRPAHTELVPTSLVWTLLQPPWPKMGIHTSHRHHTVERTWQLPSTQPHSLQWMVMSYTRPNCPKSWNLPSLDVQEAWVLIPLLLLTCLRPRAAHSPFCFSEDLRVEGSIMHPHVHPSYPRCSLSHRWTL